MNALDIDQLPRRRIAFLPTPLVELGRLSKHLGGPKILMKRDDQTGLGMGGNKARKIEFLIGEALSQGCDTVVTGGAVQSNHCRQTAAAAAAAGLRCHLALGGRAPSIPAGNLLLDHLFGATIHWTGEERKGEQIPGIVEGLRRRGRHAYVIPYGGSNAVGATGFALAMLELEDQLSQHGRNVDCIVLASSSGGTQAGLTAGARLSGFAGRIVGIGVDKDEAGEGPYETFLAHLATMTAERLGLEAAYSEENFTVSHDYEGDGYGVVGDLEREAIKLTAQLEGILLDPVYTGRAMGGLIDMIQNRDFSSRETVLFWHTGGTPALFPYALELMEKLP